MRSILTQIHQGSRSLALAGWLQFATFAVMLAIAPFDSRVIMGLNPWIKPIKFTISTGIYLWTIAWLLKDLRAPRALKSALGASIAIIMTIEIACIVLQAARGTTSHYNFSTPFDAAVFSTMGLLILLNSVLVAVLLVAYLTPQPALPAPYLWGVRLGLLAFFGGSLEGMAMIFNHAHTVGMPDGTPGLPFVNWSTRAGDLRVAHMLGLHTLQVFPLVGAWLSRRPGLRAGLGVTWLLAFVAVYAAVTIAVFAQAMRGEPLVAW